jgi:hypothetical protein
MTAGRDPTRPGLDVPPCAWDDLFFSASDILSGLPVARSTDGGRSWTVAYAARHSLLEGCSFTQYLGAQPIVDPASGSLYVAAERFQVDDPDCQGAEEVISEVIFRSPDVRPGDQDRRHRPRRHGPDRGRPGDPARAG